MAGGGGGGGGYGGQAFLYGGQSGGQDDPPNGGGVNLPGGYGPTYRGVWQGPAGADPRRRRQRRPLNNFAPGMNPVAR